MQQVNNDTSFLKGNLLILIFVMTMFSSSVVSAEGCAPEGFMGKALQGIDNMTISETCPTCDFINISIKAPNQTFIISNQPLTLSDEVFQFVLLPSQIPELGTYNVEGFSNLDFPLKACFVVTNIPVDVTEGESSIYLILALASFFMFILCLWGAIVVPFKNKRNEFAQIIKVERLKYFKIALVFLAYLFFTWFVNLMVSMSNNLVELTQWGGFFVMMFQFMIAMAWPMFVMMFIYMSILAIKDLKLNDLLMRGIKPRG